MREDADRQPQYLGTDSPRRLGIFGLVLLALGLNFVLGMVGLDLPLGALLLAGFFTSMAVRGCWWAWIPAFIFGSKVFNDVVGFFEIGDVGLPMLFMAGGFLVLMRDRIPDASRKFMWLVLGFLALTSIFGDDHDGRADRFAGREIELRPAAGAIPVAAGRTYVLVTASGDVQLRNGLAVSVSDLEVTEHGNEIFIRANRPSQELSLRLPSSAQVEIRTASGDVDVDGTWKRLEVKTASGEVNVAYTGDPMLTIATASGDIDLEGYGGEDDPENTFVHRGSSGTVAVSTASGDIDVERRETELR